MDESVPVELPIDGALDLHTFQPRQVKELVTDYLAECQRRGILRVRIIHGKGIGHLRRTIHALLDRHPEVVEFHLASGASGGWGATIVHLRPRSSSATNPSTT
jgi:DNA-nicking Smr family endonuclease